MQIEVDFLKRCIKCGLPETYETIEFEKTGKCNICISAEYKQTTIDWEERKKLLSLLIDKHRGKSDYDCVIPFSGGKDSTFTLFYLIKEYGIKPLVVRFNHGFYRKTTLENTEKTLRNLGADFLEFTPNWKIVRKLMRESFERKTDFCWHCHTGIYSYPLRVATLFKIPLVFWGEPQAEISHYYSYLDDNIESEDEEKFHKVRNLGITSRDMYLMLKDRGVEIEERDLIPYTFPDSEQLKRLGYVSVPLGSFIPWDYKRNTEIIKEQLDWKIDTVEGVPGALNSHGEKMECFMQGTRDYIKYLKRGYGRSLQISAFEARSNRLTQSEAVQNSRQFDGVKPFSLQLFLEYTGLSEDEFYDYCRSAIIPPMTDDAWKTEISERLWDSDTWYRER